MRTKEEILEATHRNALKASGPKDISLIHSLHKLEVLIDIRDILKDIHEDYGHLIRGYFDIPK
ncbi:hypothetical protein ES702_06774 [subsurface metagenome]